MTLKNDILEYTNDDGFVAGTPAQGHGRVADNHIMFSAEYFVTLVLRGEAEESDHNRFIRLANKVVSLDGVLHRYPGDDENTEGPDNWLGLLAGLEYARSSNDLYALMRRAMLEQILDHGYNNRGEFNPTKSKEFNWNNVIWRFPQILTATLAVADKLRWYYAPLTVFTALLIATSCMRTKPDSTDERRLSWLLMVIMTKHSVLCRLASRLWWRRLRKDYGDEGLRKVQSIYFSPEHPFAKYMVNDWELKNENR